MSKPDLLESFMLCFYDDETVKLINRKTQEEKTVSVTTFVQNLKRQAALLPDDPEEIRNSLIVLGAKLLYFKK